MGRVRHLDPGRLPSSLHRRPLALEIDVGGAREAHIIGQPYPVDVPLTDSDTELWTQGAKGDPTGTTSDEIWLWDQGADVYQKNWLYDLGVPSPYNGTWMDAEMAMPTGDILARGTAWWYYSFGDPPRAPGWTWTEPLPY